MLLKTVSSIVAADPFDCVIIAAYGNKLGQGVAKLDRHLAIELELMFSESYLSTQACGHESYCSKTLGQQVLILLIQFGAAEKVSTEFLRNQLTAAINDANKSEKQSLLLCLPELSVHATDLNQYYQLLAQFCQMTAYDRQQQRYDGEKELTLQNITFFDDRFKSAKNSKTKFKKSIKAYLEIGSAVARGINFSKAVSDLPANVCTPAYIASQALELSKDNELKTTVLDEGQMRRLKMNCVLAVSAGSRQPAKFIEMRYNGADTEAPVVVLIGKGVTFDSGGYSIKSAPGMHEMKFDMCGAATVMGTMYAISQLKLPLNVIALMPCSENLINGRAFKPGDVLTSMSGQTVEILSTDAEGRLLIADALSYSKRFNPALVIDVATLTGAAITALGHDISAVMSNNQTLSKQICKAGKMCHDYVWPLPAWEEYSESLNSNFADMASSAGRSGNSGAGASVAACFLSKFITDYRWAHLDVAGTAWYRGKNLEATGRPVALLSQFLINYCQKPF